VTYVICIAILPRQQWLEAVRILQAAAALSAMVALGREFFLSVSREHPDRVDAITISSWLKDFSFFWIGIWLLLFRLSSDQIETRAYWMLDTAFLGFFSGFVPAIASGMVAFIPGVFRADPQTGLDAQPGHLILAGVIAGVGMISVLVVLTVRPDAHVLVESLKPLVP
jgi:hypothetical protein